MNGKKIMCLAGVMCALVAFPAAAEIRQLEIDATVEGMSVPEAGQPFLPMFELDEDGVTLESGTEPALQDPTKPVVMKADIYSSDEVLSDNLRVGGKGIRRTYVDSVSLDQGKASVRLELYPFYQLQTPENLQEDGGKLSWDSVPYAGSYEVIVSYTTKNGDEKQTRKTTNKTSVNLSAYFSEDSRYTDVDAAVRAIPSNAKNYQYCNIAKSAFAALNGTADLSDYEEDDVWAKVGQYQAVEDSETGNYVSGSGYLSAGGPSADADGTWKRVAYRWQYLENGKPLTETWRQIKGCWYHFDAEGYMQTGWLQDGGKWYYLAPEVGASQGVMATGERQIDGQTYYFDASGAMGSAD